MKGFKDFIMRGSLIDTAVAFILGTAFAAVTTAFTKLIMDVIGKFFGMPDFGSTSVAGISVGPFLTALVSFIILAAVVYFAIVKPIQALKALKGVEEEAPETELSVLSEIRALLTEQQKAPKA